MLYFISAYSCTISHVTPRTLPDSFYSAETMWKSIQRMETSPVSARGACHTVLKRASGQQQLQLVGERETICSWLQKPTLQEFPICMLRAGKGN
ncbi:hypothetical protein CDAR_571561 [Caerostris darwini]|uniref:Uncharacterized protein n=1 Tax=Caerostris darwini TaxID=1538125 RepID=A0AAV4WDF1_9ARAC|nr:hypothetical protein CDAR_571561 [Caerostris darwini]